MQGTTRLITILILALVSQLAIGQSDYISLQNKQYQLLDRLDIIRQNDSILGFTSVKPYNRHQITKQIAYLSILNEGGMLDLPLSKVDKYNIRQLILSNSEWAKEYADSIMPQNRKTKALYRTPANLYSIDTKDFTLRINPLLNIQYGNANDKVGHNYINARGIGIRGQIANKIGFYTNLIETQERVPEYVRQFEDKIGAIPGQGWFKRDSNNVDYTNISGGITFNSGKYFDFTFAYDKLFIGNGFRSLFLSDFGANYLFLKINTKIWRLNYQNIFAEQVAPYLAGLGDVVRPKKYMTAHYLNFQASKNVNIGLFECISFARGNGFELHYLNPVIFLRGAERELGSADKASIGFDIKVNAFKKAQFYSQLLINELVMKEFFRPGRGDWRNKQALQIGAKYIDAFGIANLDLLAEANFIRPFVYSHFDSTTSFSHYNQPLAHPLGANLKEYVLLVKYQPTPRWYFQGKLIAYKQGLDSAGANFGSNIFLNYNTRVRDQDIFIGSGTPVNSLTLGFNTSYEVFENIFLDFNATYRTYNVKDQPKSNVFFYSIGFRANLQRREFNF